MRKINLRSGLELVSTSSSYSLPVRVFLFRSESKAILQAADLRYWLKQIIFEIGVYLCPYIFQTRTNYHKERTDAFNESCAFSRHFGKTTEIVLEYNTRLQLSLCDPDRVLAFTFVAKTEEGMLKRDPFAAARWKTNHFPKSHFAINKRFMRTNTPAPAFCFRFA